MANENKVIIEFVGDASGLKPAVDALKAIGKLSDEQVKSFNAANESFKKTAGGMDKAAKSADKIESSTKSAAKSADDFNKSAKNIPDNLRKGQNEASKFDKTVGGIRYSLKRLAVATGIAFGLNEIKQFITQSSKLAAEAEGVETAFKRIGNPALLEGLRNAVRGTVSDVELMKQAVRASNFKIPLDKLASLFEFARRRAKETGESVDFLVNSIVLGIGRKSPLILDNLGISAVELRKRLGGVSSEAAEIGDIAEIVGQIATDELAKMGEEAITTADRMGQLSASWQNLQRGVGDAVNKSALYYAELFGIIDGIDPVLEGQKKAASNLAESFRDVESGIYDVTYATERMVAENEKFQANQKRLFEIEDEIQRKRDEGFIKQSEIVDGQRVSGRKYIELLEQEAEQLNENQNFLREYITQLKLRIDTENKAANTTVKQVNNIALLNDQLKTLKEQLETAKLGSVDFYRIADQITAKSEQLKNVLDELKFRSEFLDERGRPQFTPMETIEPETTRFGEFGEFQFIEQNDVVVVDNLNNSLAGLNVLLDEAVEKRSKAGEFTSEFDKWEKRVAMLEKRIETFGDRVIKTNDDIKNSTSDAATKTSNNWEISTAEIIRGFGQMFDVIATIQSNALKHEQKQLEHSLEQGEISREQYEQRRKQLLRQQAKNEKSNAIFSAIINTAAAIVEALPNIPLSLLAGVIGAAQIGAISSQPIPQFAKGTKNAPAGFKWVGENGAELIYDNGGYPIITHSESNVINDNPYSTQSKRIFDKYDIPQIHTGLFGQKSIGIRDDIEINSSRSAIDYDRLASAMVQSMRGNTRNTLNAIDRHRMTDRDGFEMVVRAIAKKQNQRSLW